MAALCARLTRLAPGNAVRLASEVRGTLSKNHIPVFSSAINHVRHKSIVVEKDKGVAELIMQREPSNSWNLEFLEEFCLALEDLENNRDCRGIIIKSSIPQVFSYGLDINEYYQTKKERLRVFRRRYQEFWMRLYGSRLATIATVTGNSPGGGCLIALSCDYRIMAPGFKIGYNEIKGGLLAPSWFIDTMASVVGNHITERSVQVGLMFNSDDALRVGMVDQVVPLEEVSATAYDTMNLWLSVPDNVRAKAKMTLRQNLIQKLQATREEDIRDFIARVQKDYTQDAIENLLKTMREKGHDTPFIWGED